MPSSPRVEYPARLPVRAIVWLACATFTAVACTRVTDPLIDLIAMEFGVSAGQASVVVTTYGVAYGLLQVFYGPVGDRWGKYRIVFITCALSTFGCFACALSGSLQWLALARLLTGATAGALFPMSVAWIADRVPFERRQAMLARFVVANFLGSLIGSVLSGLMAEHWGWRSVFYLVGVLFFGVAIGLYLEIRRNPLTREMNAGSGSMGASFRNIASYLADRKARNFLLMSAVMAALMMSPFVYIPLHGQREFGLSPSQSTTLMASSLLGGTLYLASAGVLTRRLARSRLIIVSATIVTTTMLGSVFASEITCALILLGALGFGATMLQNTFMARATQFSPQARGVAVTLFSGSQYMSAAAGVWIEGLVVDVAGTRTLFGLCAFGLPAVLFVFIRRMRRLDNADSHA